MNVLPLPPAHTRRLAGAVRTAACPWLMRPMHQALARLEQAASPQAQWPLALRWRLQVLAQ